MTFRPTHLTICLVILILATAAVSHAGPSPVPIQVDANSLSLEPMPGFSHGVLTVGMRGVGVVYKQGFSPDQGLVYALQTDRGEPLADGRYVFEVWMAGKSAGTARLSGTFEVVNGSVSSEQLEEDIKEDRLDVPIEGDAIVEGSICVSDSVECLVDLIILESESFDTPGFGAADIKVKDNVPEIWFADTTAEDGDFAITVEDSFFFVRDPDADTLPFTIESGAPSDSLYVSQAGGVGIGTAIPEADIHVTNLDGSIDTVLKLHHPGSGSWNVGMTATGFFAFNKAGTGGREFTARERNHSVATLDVQGHVRGTSFKSTSSRAMKTGFEALNPTEVLAKVTELPVTSWRYRTEAEEVRHFGPVAEDFQRLFGLGDGKTISTVDADGVALAAIQGLKRELERKDQQIADLNARLVALEARLDVTSP